MNTNGNLSPVFEMTALLIIIAAEELVELGGIEPPTSTLPVLRSPS